MRYWDRVEQIQSRLGNRKLVYFGTRGTDARPLLNLGLLDAVFCQIAPLQVPGVEEVCLETLKGVRVDLNSYSIDKDPSPEVKVLRDRMLQRFGRPAAVVPYRPAELLTATWFPRADRVKYLGVFHEKQACFEHKPWVENELGALGVPVLPWTYYSDADRVLIEEALRTGSLVLRANKSDGGAGLDILNTPEQLSKRWPAHTDGFLAAAPLYSPSVPLNVNACVFRGGKVALHSPSIQLIGLKECTTRRFGYCGNDFAGIAGLELGALRQLEHMTRAVGQWLDEEGYLGAFGVDALLYDGRVHLVEVNPRFQGSSATAAELMEELDLPDLMLDHIAAFLNLPAPPSLSLEFLSKKQSELVRSHVIFYNTCHVELVGRGLSKIEDTSCFQMLPADGTSVEPEGVLGTLEIEDSITLYGHDVSCAGKVEYINQLEAFFRPLNG